MVDRQLFAVVNETNQTAVDLFAYEEDAEEQLIDRFEKTPDHSVRPVVPDPDSSGLQDVESGRVYENESERSVRELWENKPSPPSLNTVHLNQPNHLNPDETHQYDVGTSVRIDGVPGEILERGYERGTGTGDDLEPVYGVIRDDNVESTFMEREVEETERIEIIDSSDRHDENSMDDSSNEQSGMGM